MYVVTCNEKWILYEYKCKRLIKRLDKNKALKDIIILF